MIVDASVIVRWFLADEADAERAYALRRTALARRSTANVPSACWMELSHSLARAIRRGRLPAGSVEMAIEALTEIVALIDTHEVDPVASLRVALDLGLGAYESAYLILSRTLGESFITADRRQYEVGIAAGYDVVWLGDVDAD